MSDLAAVGSAASCSSASSDSLEIARRLLQAALSQHRPFDADWPWMAWCADPSSTDFGMVKDWYCYRAEAVVSRCLEEAGIGLHRAPLQDLVAFMVSENGHHEIVTADALPPAVRLFQYLHLLGHLQHEGDTQSLRITYEVRDRNRLIDETQASERLIDLWADRFVKNDLRAACHRESAIACGLLLALESFPPVQVWPRRLLHVTSHALLSIRPIAAIYERARLSPFVQGSLARTYRWCGSLRLRLQALATWLITVGRTAPPQIQAPHVLPSTPQSPEGQSRDLVEHKVGIAGTVFGTSGPTASSGSALTGPPPPATT